MKVLVNCPPLHLGHTDLFCFSGVMLSLLLMKYSFLMQHSVTWLRYGVSQRGSSTDNEQVTGNSFFWITSAELTVRQDQPQPGTRMCKTHGTGATRTEH